jgi:hypothetical protein
MAEKFDAIIIGAGQAGPALAARRDREGQKTALIERKLVGGTCVNTGCIPTKTMVASARAAHMARRGAEFGFAAGEVRVDMGAVKRRKDAVVKQSVDGVTQWITGLKHVALIRGHARFTGAHALSVDGRQLEAAVLLGEQRFADVGCAGCHVPALPLTGNGRVFVEPNPFNPPGNLRPGDAPALSVDLNDKVLPSPRLEADKRTGITWVPAFTDLKLHDITYGADDPNRETLNMHFAAGSVEFFAGNGRFLTKKLWGAANEPPYFHHGKYTTMREAILAHYGEADASRLAFEGLSSHEQDSIIEFLKTLQVLPPGTKFLIVDEKFHRRQWPPGNLVMAR